MDNNTVSGLLVNDISDHLPVFTVYNDNHIKNKQGKESMDAFKNEMLKQDWDFLNKENDTDKAYNEFEYNEYLQYYMIKIVQLNNTVENKSIKMINVCQRDCRMLAKRKTHYVENL